MAFYDLFVHSVVQYIIHGAEVYKSGEASRWRVCYQWGLTRLVCETDAVFLGADTQ